jgi:hypothetical protein
VKQSILVITFLGCIASMSLAADKQPVACEGVIMHLNKPGAIAVEVSIGSADGLKPGDILLVVRNEKRIGKLQIAKAEHDRSSATITAVEDGQSLKTGDRLRRPR